MKIKAHNKRDNARGRKREFTLQTEKKKDKSRETKEVTCFFITNIAYAFSFSNEIFHRGYVRIIEHIMIIVRKIKITITLIMRMMKKLEKITQ